MRSATVRNLFFWLVGFEDFSDPIRSKLTHHSLDSARKILETLLGKTVKLLSYTFFKR